MNKSVSLESLTEVIRSKNAGPFLITLDLFFKDQAGYELVKKSGVLTQSKIAALYRIPEKDVLVIQSLDQVLGMKITFRRHIPAGDPGDRDVYGAQQHLPLFQIEVPLNCD